MTEEGTAEKSADEDFSDEALNRALEGKEEKTESKTEEKSAETTEQPATKKEAATTEQKPEAEDLDHKESSRLGRKFKGLESRFDQILARLDQLAKPTEKEPEIEIPEVIMTPEDVEKVLQARDAKLRKGQSDQVQEQAKYEQGYLKTLDALEDDNEDLHGEVMELITSNAKKGSFEFNRKYSDNPVADARINYAEAKAFLLKSKLSSGKPSVPERKNKSEKQPIQPAAAETKTTTKTEKAMPKLDGYAASYVEYLKRNGATDAEIAETLSEK